MAHSKNSMLGAGGMGKKARVSRLEVFISPFSEFSLFI